MTYSSGGQGYCSDAEYAQREENQREWDNSRRRELQKEYDKKHLDVVCSFYEKRNAELEAQLEDAQETIKKLRLYVQSYYDRKA